jgi:hypothetical protein
MSGINLQYIFVRDEEMQRSNEPLTCLWCGKKLRKSKHMDERGDYGDNAFCGLRCGYSFGVAMEKNGHRLKPFNGKKGV